jgi:hypothetical protein
LRHQLLPDAEIRLLSLPTGHDAVFRVVSKLHSPELQHTYWGIENLAPDTNLWGVEIPPLRAGDQFKVRVVLECPRCAAAESLRLDEILLASLEEKGGVERACRRCNAFGMWKLLPFHEV